MKINKKQFIIYGAGCNGKWSLDFLKWRNIDDRVWGFCDKEYDKIKYVDDKKVVSYEKAKQLNYPFLISCTNEEIEKEILEMIKKDNGEVYCFNEFYKILNEDQTVFFRKWCAYHHAKDNNQWFIDAENEKAIDVFWGSESLFYKNFKKLNLKNVIELACGRGRHVPHYINLAEKITLVDILEENISFCKERFKEEENIFYLQNNGYNFEKLLSNNYTAIFSYDSMVHFELMDIYEYLKDMYRVLIVGGRALLHHSNYDENYMVDFAHTSHARCFMNKDVFAYLAFRVGFKIISQEIIDWYDTKKLDCITLLEK